jgi:hypothetical protein
VSYRFVFALGFGALALLMGSVERAPAAPQPPLASHRAVYSLKLARASSNAAVNAAAGQLVVEWRDTCDGYTTNQRFLTEFSDSEGHSTTTDLWVSSWEAHDGGVFRFNLTTSTNGAVQERSRGLAKRGGAKAEVNFEEPKSEKRSLPAQVSFPTAHTAQLIEAALRGERTIERIVFDGGVENGLSYVSAFIGKELPPRPAPAVAQGKAAALAEGRAWPIRLAFYPFDKGDDVPDYEMAFTLHENGVATDFEFDYGEFALTAELSKIEALPGCAKN